MSSPDPYLVLCFLLIASATAFAQPPRRGGENPFDRADRNGDGVVSQGEFRGPDRAFNKMDTDGNGVVSRKEMRSFHEGRSGEDTGRKKSKYEGPYPDLVIKKYDRQKAWDGNVIFVDKNYNRIVEASLDGKIVWECEAPEPSVCSFESKSCGTRLTDVEILPNNNLLILIGNVGAYEIDRDGDVVWSYLNSTVSHDADRLPNGNVIMACVGAEKASEFPYNDPQAIEVDRDGKIVWAWYAKKEYENSIYKDVRSEDANDWTHMNSVQRLDDGNTLLSVRNWNLLIAVDDKGRTVWKTGVEGVPTGPWGKESPHCPHTPVLLDNGNIIISEPIKGRVVEWDPQQSKVVWSYPVKNWKQGGPYYFVRAAHRLPNGNTFIIDSLGQFLEVTTDGEIVWYAQLPSYEYHEKPPSKEEIPKVPCFNADRCGMPYYGGR